MALLKNKQYLNTAILTCKNIHRIFSVEHYSKILPLLFKLYHIRFMLNSNKGPACYGKDMLNCQTVSYRTCLSPESNEKNFNAEIRSYFFPDKNPLKSTFVPCPPDSERPGPFWPPQIHQMFFTALSDSSLNCLWPQNTVNSFSSASWFLPMLSLAGLNFFHT